MHKIILMSILIMGLSIPAAFAEQHEFTNTLPSYLEIEQNDVIFLKNLTDSVINLRHTGGLFSSGELYTNGTWTGNMPYDAGVYEWINVNSTGTIVIKDKVVEEQAIVVFQDNKVSGKISNVEQTSLPVAVTTISPSFSSQTIPVKTQQNGDFETTLDLTEVGTHDIIVSYDGEVIGKISKQITQEEVNSSAGIDILQLRLSLLETLERILEIIFGK